MSATSSGASSNGMISFVAQLKLKKIPEKPTTDQDFMINLQQNDTNTVPEINEIFDKLKSAITKSNKKEFKNYLNYLHIVDKKLIRKYLSTTDIDLFYLLSKYSQLEMLEYLIDQTDMLPYLSALDKTKEDDNIKKSFFNCMCNDNTAMLEKFYDYVAGDLHWVINKTSSKNDFENLKNNLHLLNESYIEYKDMLNKENTDVNPQTIIDCLGIISFNEFQIELYEKLNIIKKEIDDWQPVSNYDNTIREIQVLISIIDITISLHADYSMNKIDERFPILLLLENEDKFTLYRKAQKFFMFRKFFWKTDYNVCLLILDNLYLLKERLKLPGSIYQELESQLYYFIYNCKSKWSFYLSKTEMVPVGNLIAQHNDTLHILQTSFNYDMGALWTFLIVYLERQHYLDKLYKFKEKLKVTILPENIKLDKTEMSPNEQQSLIPLPEMKDDFSLRKMYRSLEVLPNTDDINHKTEWAQLVIERILQVIGEFIKNTEQSKHLEDTTQSLMLAEIPMDAVNSLKAIRLFLSKSDKCQILWRIEISKHVKSVLEKVLNDLQQLKKNIKRVININRYLVNRSLINCCRNILNERKECIRKSYQDILHLNFDTVSCDLGINLRNPTEYDGNPFFVDFYESHWKKTGLSVDLMMEVAQLQHDLNMLSAKHDQVQINIKTFINKNYSHYKEVILSHLHQIGVQKCNWDNIKLQCLQFQDISISEYPNYVDLNKIRTIISISENKKDESEFKYLADLLNYVTDIKPLWDMIEKIFDFIINKCKVLNYCNDEIKKDLITNLYKDLCQTKYTTDIMSENVKLLLSYIEEACIRVEKSVVRNSYKYDGIKEFEKILLVNNFVTEEEIQYIIKYTPESQRHKVNSLTSINSNFLLEINHYVNVIITLQPFDTKSEEIIRNIKNRNPDLLKCYLNRLKSIKTLLKDQPQDLLILQYKYIGQFKISLEMLLIDIFNILKMCNKDEKLRKTNKLLTEINLRHVLTHGCPLLEVVGEFLDANDVPRELIRKALECIKDLESVQALSALKNTNFDFNLIHMSVECFDKDKQLLIETFKRAENWKQYLSFLPENIEVKKKAKSKKKTKTKQKSQSEFSKAINIQAIDKIKDLINNVDLDEVDNNGKAAIHHVAMHGNMEILQLLIENGVDIDIINAKDNNRTALHYAVMKGNSGALDFLLKSGAAVKQDLNGDTYRDIEEKQKDKSKERNIQREDLEDIVSDFEVFGIYEMENVSIDNN